MRPISHPALQNGLATWAEGVVTKGTAMTDAYGDRASEMTGDKDLVLATIFLDRPGHPNVARLIERFGAMLGVTRGEPNEAGFVATVGSGAGAGDGTGDVDRAGRQLIALTVDTPMPRAHWENSAAMAWWWPEASAALDRNRARIEVMCPWAGNSRLEAHIKQTVVVRELLDQMPGAIGVMWGSMPVSAQQFAGEYHRFQAEHIVPVRLWVLIQLSRDEHGATVASTLGLDKFGLMEIEATNVPLAPADVLAVIEGMANYLIQRGPVINDGDRAGGELARHVARVHIAPSFRGGSRDVYRLEFSPDLDRQTQSATN